MGSFRPESEGGERSKGRERKGTIPALLRLAPLIPAGLGPLYTSPGFFSSESRAHSSQRPKRKRWRGSIRYPVDRTSRRGVGLASVSIHPAALRGWLCECCARTMLWATSWSSMLWATSCTQRRRQWRTGAGGHRGSP